MTVFNLIDELESSINSGCPAARVGTLRKITNLFLSEASRLSEDQVSLFDDLLIYLSQKIEKTALVELSISLASVGNAPPRLVGHLARNNEIEVAGPVLTHSIQMKDEDLAEIAQSRPESHLYAISQRSEIDERVTDVLIEHGSRRVAHMLVRNKGAKFSDAGFSALVKSADRDDTLCELLGARLDIPQHLLKKLFTQATEIARSRILMSAPAEHAESLLKFAERAATNIKSELVKSRDYVASDRLVENLNIRGELSEKALCQFARDGRHAEITSALALFCNAPAEFVERIVENANTEGLVILCKAAKFHWSSLDALLKAGVSSGVKSEQELNETKIAFARLSHAAANRALRFMMVQATVKRA